MAHSGQIEKRAAKSNSAKRAGVASTLALLGERGMPACQGHHQRSSAGRAGENAAMHCEHWD